MAAVLTRLQRRVFDFAWSVSKTMPDGEQIEATLQDTRKVQGPALLIGGIAVIHFGYRRSTDDVDLLYAQKDGTILKRLRPYFKTVQKAKNGWHHLEHKKLGVRLELIPEGGLSTNGFIPGPDIVDGRDGFISFEGLVWLKLVSGRLKDLADLAELAKRNMKRSEAAYAHVRPELKDMYRQVLDQARKENEHNPGG